MRATILLAATLLAQALNAQHLTIDASAPIPPPAPTTYHGGTATNPSGETIRVNSRYLTLNNKPWLPVMGEFHFSRVPAGRWEEQLLKMKAGGVDIVSTYIFWIHHEELEGQWDWTGDRDLRRFVQLCAKHHLYVLVRIGPWAHGEARNGGLPDWLLAKTPHTRRNDPIYLEAVDKFYGQIGDQLHGLFWKDGGPIVGVQIENEYSARGEGAGEQHLLTLKQLALKHGFDVPLYTLTGWNNAVFPRGEFLQVFGGYPDAPWDDSLKDLPPQEVYAFRFGSRVSGNMGAIGASTTAATPKPTTYDFPFLTAEVGGGNEATYHRRPVIAPDDVVAMMPVLLGSGANLYGTYMFQGGINPDGKATTLQESLVTKYPNDLPIKDYDFQAPLSAFGDETPLFRKLKVFNEFLHTFGEQLAPMPAFAPDQLPANPTDLTVPRVALRTDGQSGFLFFNNYVRGARTPNHTIQVTIKLPHGELTVPHRPTLLWPGTYGIWPINLTLGPVHILYATSQPITHTVSGNTDTYYFEPAFNGSEFAIAPSSGNDLQFNSDAKRETLSDGTILVHPRANGKPFLTATDPNGHITQFHLLWPDMAENASVVHTPHGDKLLFTRAQTFADDTFVYFEDESTRIAYTLDNQPTQTLTTPNVIMALATHETPPTAPAPPVRSVTIPGRHPRTVAAYPTDDAMKAAGTETLSIAPSTTAALRPGLEPGLHDLTLDVFYIGDVAQLLSGSRLLDDNLFNGQHWHIELSRWKPLLDKPLTLRVLPLRSDAPVYLRWPGGLLRNNPQSYYIHDLVLATQYLYRVPLSDLTAAPPK